MAFALLSRSRSKPPGSVKSVSKRKSAGVQRATDSRPGFAKPAFQPQTAALPTASVIQTKLNVGEPNDVFEQEADRVADEAMRMPDGAIGVAASPRSGMFALQRKCACGNHTMVGGECSECSKKKRLGLQTKLKVNEPGDIYEQEADRIADQVMADPARGGVTGTPPHIQRYSGPSTGQWGVVPASVDQALASPGRPLEPALRRDMEQRFGHDFSRVRVHTDAKAAESARLVDALAYTVGWNVVFSEGYYKPHLRRGSQLLAHELAHVVQQARGGDLPPALTGGILEQSADAAASAFSAGYSPINVAGACAPGLARQPRSFEPILKVNREPRSLKESLNPENLDYAVLLDEIERIQEWLAENPSAPESNSLRLELKAFRAAELRLIEQREAEGLGPKEGSVAKLISIVHKGRLETELGLWPGHCFLAKGTMEWRLEAPESVEGKGKKQRMQIRFTPAAPASNKTITFLQTFTEKGAGGAEDWRLDLLQNKEQLERDFGPFYGTRWSREKKKWIPELMRPEETARGYKSQPSSASDPAAYLYDEPFFFPPPHGRIFQTAAVAPETGETLGVLTWGVGAVPESVRSPKCSDKTTATFAGVVGRFYAARKPGSIPGEEHYDAIVEAFAANDAALSPGQKHQVDAVIDKARKAYDPNFIVVIGGFGDAMDKDAMGTSEQRAQAVANYFIDKGIPKRNLVFWGYGASWVLYPPSTKEAQEGRNRRVQVRLFY